MRNIKKNKTVANSNIFNIKNIRYLFVLCALACVFNVYSQSTYRYVKNEAFGFGEKLEYKVGIIGGVLSGLGGSGGLSIAPKPVIREGRECYDVRFWVDSEGVVDLTYPVHDKYRSVIDVAGIFPYEFYQQIREGKFKRDFKASFDQTNNFAYANNKKYKIDEYMHDLISAFYYVRTLDISLMKDGSIFYLKNFYKDTTFNLPVQVIRRENIKVPAGKFRTIVIQPKIEDGSPFKFHSNISIWLTDDERKIPVRVATSIVIGEAGAELTRYSGVRGKISAKIE